MLVGVIGRFFFEGFVVLMLVAARGLLACGFQNQS